MTRTLLLLVLAVGTACSSIAHLRELRELQDDFSNVAALENQSTIAAAAPSIDALARAAAARNQKLQGSATDPELYHRAYFEVGQRLAALQERAGSDLKSDGLLGTCQTLQVLALWRTTFYGQYLQHGGDGNPIPVNPPPAAMSSVWTEAQATAKRIQDNKWQVYPRDQFLLHAMEPLVMHDIAYLNALRNQDTTQTAAMTALIEEFAKAEEKLAGIKLQPHLAHYAVLSRYIMLRNAYVLFQHAGLDPLTFTSAGVQGLGTFQKRVNQFRTDFRETVNGQNHQALRNLGLDGKGNPGNKLDLFPGGGLPELK